MLYEICYTRPQNSNRQPFINCQPFFFNCSQLALYDKISKNKILLNSINIKYSLVATNTFFFFGLERISVLAQMYLVSSGFLQLMTAFRENFKKYILWIFVNEMSSFRTFTCTSVKTFLYLFNSRKLLNKIVIQTVCLFFIFDLETKCTSVLIDKQIYIYFLF